MGPLLNLSSRCSLMGTRREYAFPWHWSYTALPIVTGLASSAGRAHHLLCDPEQGSFPTCTVRWPKRSPGSFTVWKGDTRRHEAKIHDGRW